MVVYLLRRRVSGDGRCDHYLEQRRERPGALDEPTGLRIEGHMMVASKADWEDLSAAPPLYAGDWDGPLFDAG